MKCSLSFLNQNSYVIYNRNVAQVCKSVNAAIMLSELVNRYMYHSENNELISHSVHGEGWFYFTSDKCEERTCLSRREQDSGIKILQSLDLIEVISFGLPAKRHFRLKEQKILDIFGFSKKKSSLAENAKLDSTKTPNYTYKEPYKEPNLTTSTTSTEDVVVDDGFHSYPQKKVDNFEDATKEAAKSLQKCLSQRVNRWGPGWNIPFSIIETLMKKFGSSYVNDQVQYMLAQQEQSLKDQNSSAKKKKTNSIDKPETYLRLACEKNYAISENRRK